MRYSVTHVCSFFLANSYLCPFWSRAIIGGAVFSSQVITTIPRFHRSMSMVSPCPLKNHVGSRRSDNFEGTGRTHSSIWMFLPRILGEHIEIGVNFKIWGDQATIKWDNPYLCLPKTLVLGLILGRKPWFDQFLPHLPPLIYTSLESCGAWLSFGAELSRFEASYKPSEFC